MVKSLAQKEQLYRLNSLPCRPENDCSKMMKEIAELKEKLEIVRGALAEMKRYGYSVRMCYSVLEKALEKIGGE